MSEIKIRTAITGDAPFIEAIEKKYINEAWSLKLIEDEIIKNESIFLVAEYEGEIIGYISGDNIVGEFYINNIAVDEKVRRKGAGTVLLDEICNEAKKNDCVLITLEVRSKNAGAIGLYEKLGFKAVGIRKNYYSAPKDDAVIYTKELK